MSSIYIDESGYSDLLAHKHRFFIMTGVVISDEELKLAQILLQKWKKKHFHGISPVLHAYDLFETNIYNATQLRTNRGFTSAIDQLIEIIRMINLKAYCGVFDLKIARKNLSVSDPPDKLNFKSVAFYKKAKKVYALNFEKTHGLSKRQLPLESCLAYILGSHKKYLDEVQSSSATYVNFESLSANDAKVIEIFHKLQSGAGTIYAQYGQEVCGIQFHTKSSLSAAIEIADLISYTTMQSYRAKFKLDEIKDVPKRSLIELKKVKREINKFTTFEYLS